MPDVHNFLDEIQEDYSVLYKENAVLKSKIKILVEKVEEYRSTEDAMRMALLTAQKMGDDLLVEAQQKHDAMMADARQTLDAQIADLKSKIADEKARLDAAKETTTKFVSASRELISQHSDFLAKLDTITAPEPEPEPEPSQEEIIVDTAMEIDKNVSKLLYEQNDFQQDSDDDSEYDDFSESTKLFRMKTDDVDWSDDDEPTSPRPKFNFDNLQFGTNYGEDDE